MKDTIMIFLAGALMGIFIGTVLGDHELTLEIPPPPSPQPVQIINVVDTVYVPQPADSAEIAVGYLRSNGAFGDE